jgi:inward rectifier potassium channel
MEPGERIEVSVEVPPSHPATENDDSANRAPLSSKEDINRDLGFGTIASTQRNERLLNRDGTFNVGDFGASFLEPGGFYQYMISLGWLPFIAWIGAAYLAINVAFALAYLACGPGSISGGRELSPFLNAFFFSVDSFATIGYGNIAPIGVAANSVVTLESLTGLVLFAVAAGLVFARFARPTANIVYSSRALIAPYHDIRAFMFRMVNGRRNQLIELHALVIMTRYEDGQRQFYQLPLERERVAFFPLTWTVVHPINQASPLHGWTAEQAVAAKTEFLVLISAFDETFSQTVQSRTSYTADEVVWNARFIPAFRSDEKGRIAVDMRKLHDFEDLAA